MVAAETASNSSAGKGDWCVVLERNPADGSPTAVQADEATATVAAAESSNCVPAAPSEPVAAVSCSKGVAEPEDVSMVALAAAEDAQADVGSLTASSPDKASSEPRAAAAAQLLGPLVHVLHVGTGLFSAVAAYCKGGMLNALDTVYCCFSFVGRSCSMHVCVCLVACCSPLFVCCLTSLPSASMTGMYEPTA